jgi:hypothetical protein
VGGGGRGPVNLRGGLRLFELQYGVG